MEDGLLLHTSLHVGDPLSLKLIQEDYRIEAKAFIQKWLQLVDFG